MKGFPIFATDLGRSTNITIKLRKSLYIFVALFITKYSRKYHKLKIIYSERQYTRPILISRPISLQLQAAVSSL